MSLFHSHFPLNFRTYENGSLLIDKSNAEDEGQYLCKAQNGVGEGISKLAEVTINGKSQKLQVRCSRATRYINKVFNNHAATYFSIQQCRLLFLNMSRTKLFLLAIRHRYYATHSETIQLRYDGYATTNL